MMLKTELMIGAQEAADLLGLKKSTIYQKVSKGELPHVKKGRSLWFVPSELREWDRQRTTSHPVDSL